MAESSTDSPDQNDGRVTSLEYDTAYEKARNSNSGNSLQKAN